MAKAKMGKCFLGFHSIKELEAEWQRQGIVKEEDVIYDDSYSDETEEDNFLT